MHDKEITYFTEGLKQVRDEFYLDAIHKFQQLVQEFPVSELADDAIYNIGLCYFKINQFEKAIEYYQKVIDIYPGGTISVLDGSNEFGKTAAKCHYAIMNCYLAFGNIEKAKEHASILVNYPDSYIIVEDKKKLFSEIASYSLSKYLNIKSMKKHSKIILKIKNAVKIKCLKQPFRVADVKKCIKDFKSKSFLSKHRKDNPGGYTVYFIREEKGLYILK